MRPMIIASATALLMALALLQPGRTAAQAQPGSLPSGGAHRGDGSHPPAHAPPNFAQPNFAPPNSAPHIPPTSNSERPGRSGWRRGQHLPPTFHGEVVGDYARYHLRRPPPGYFWYRDANDYILAAAATGLIFEVISGD